MKKLIFVCAVLVGISSLAYAGSKADCEGANKFLTNLDLDEARAYEAEQILSDFKQVKDLAMDGRKDEIPAFIQDQIEQLKVVLTEEEYQQFQENIGEWAEDKDFSKFMMMSGKKGR
ncbi:hypothetical protein [Marinimicrobium sp. ABcell2]|uniref:hypothetical protein n=1 Tax=Marinimicrobium sp. ABcell2 TaxID=3069751 RepID=UPI0027B0606F|nr:hypothetical protein [Marinimicrobium sp. ABcell2]MDQ2077657.1 hypothetical protein [Marinimicrobium sp. ABcell2]